MSRSTVDAETHILANFLLANASFPDIVDLKTFRSLFPKNLQDSPHVKRLYNHLTLQREATLATVRKNIEFEAKMSHQLLKRERREADAQNRSEDVEMLEHADMNSVMDVYGDMPAPKHDILPIQEIIKSLEGAEEKLEAETAVLDQDCDKLTKEIKDIVGDLSSLKFGTFTGANEGLIDSAIEDLARLQETCDQVLKPDE
ncbi:Inner kinetochore subunit cnl2 [Drechslerella dactyloides]|uniref:Inner kinetochore subunit cnl2 n=1 Tax=Drechslerella dactyloides TaxID=74499 RepID=A0AAD6NL96_DREDA|nr:Inner kinetochore subunit cnl2 [Drechslerella dactyloides]